MEKALGYVRVSSEEQSKEGVSLAAQTERLELYCRMRGLDLVTVYREEGISGGIPLRKRPEGAKLVAELARKGGIRHVICVKLDRLFRSTSDALAQTEQWTQAKCALHVLDMAGTALDTSSATGKMFLTLCAAFGEMERNLTAERTRAALRHKRSVREVYSRITPLGFDADGDKLVENATEMATVRQIQAMRASGQSLQQIANTLNDTGAPTKRGGKWHPVTVQSVLRIHAG